MMTLLNPIFRCWDTVPQMAAAIGETDATVRQWKNRDRIPGQHWPKIIAAAATRGHRLEWTQFVPGEAHAAGIVVAAPAEVAA